MYQLLDAPSTHPPCGRLSAPATSGLTLIHRELPAEVSAQAVLMVERRLADIRLLLAPAEAAAALHVELGSDASALCADIAMLVRSYAAATGADFVDIRLERIEDDACRAFHRDDVELRVVTTYVGPGTEYVADHDAPAALRLQRGFSGPVHTCPAGAVAWMSGSRRQAGVVHRSPPIAGTGRVRLFLALGQPSPTSPPLWRSSSAAD